MTLHEIKLEQSDLKRLIPTEAVLLYQQITSLRTVNFCGVVIRTSEESLCLASYLKSNSSSNLRHIMMPKVEIMGKEDLNNLC
jgi:hypothetical protein